MKKTILALLPLLVCCGHARQYQCVTRCGIHLTDLPSPSLANDKNWSCENLQGYEDHLLKTVVENYKQDHEPFSLRTKRPVTEESVCKAIGGDKLGVDVFMQQTPSFDYHGMEVGGLTTCEAHVIQIGRAESPFIGSLTHEMMHWLQDCFYDWDAVNLEKKRIDAAAGECVQDRLLEQTVTGIQADFMVCKDAFDRDTNGLGQFGYHAYWEELGILDIQRKVSEYGVTLREK